MAPGWLVRGQDLALPPFVPGEDGSRDPGEPVLCGRAELSPAL